MLQYKALRYNGSEVKLTDVDEVTLKDWYDKSIYPARQLSYSDWLIDQINCNILIVA